MTLRLGSFVFVAFALTACGGGGGASTPSAPPSHALVAGKLVLTIASSSPSATARTPKYISPSAVSVSISANGQAQTIADISSGSPNCTPSSGAGRVCTIALQAPVGQDTFTIAQYDGPNATGTLLGSGTAMADVVAGSPFLVQAVLNGVVKTIQLFLGTPLTAGVAGTTTLAVIALDPDGNTIVGPGTYSAPIALSVNDPSGQTTLGTSTITGPSSVPVTVTYAGGLGTSATISASASGVTTASVVFTPIILAIYYVANANANTLTAYPLTANGNTAPVRTVSGGLTGLNFVTSLANDSSGNLYVANAASQVEVFAPPANGNVAPIRTIAGANTGITGPSNLFIDAQNTLYIANCGACSGFSGAEAVLEFAAGASGNVAPIREITGSNTGFSATTAVALDGAGNMLVADSSGNPSIFVFPAAATGNVAPSGSINGSNTGLNEPQCVYVDKAGEIYVCNFSNTITVYAAGARGNVAPIRTIAGANTSLSYPNEIRFDAAGNMYVVNFFNNTVAVFPPNANGNQTPLYTLTGPATQLNGAAGITFAP